jgi:hypothetical protein
MRAAIFEVVGVVDDVLPSPNAVPQPQIFLVHGGTFAMGLAALVVRTEDDPAAVAAALRGIVRQLEPRATLDRLGPLTDKISSSLEERVRHTPQCMYANGEYHHESE